MADEIGTTTRDMRELGLPNPAEHGLNPDELESTTRRHGRHCRRYGVGILVGSWLGTLTAAITTEKGLFADGVARLFAVLGFVSLSILGGVILTAGLAERRDRHQRALTRQTITAALRRDERLDRIEVAISEIAGHLPGALETSNWQGYNAAVRDGFLQQTGTDRAAGRPPRLGLVHRSQPGAPNPGNGLPC